MAPETVAVIVAALSLLGTAYGIYANRNKVSADAASTNVQTALRLRDEALEAQAIAAQDRAAALKERAEAIRARDDANATLEITLEKLAYLEGQGVTQLRQELNAAKDRIVALETMVNKLQDELRASKMREGKTREQLNRIRRELGTGPLGGDDGSE